MATHQVGRITTLRRSAKTTVAGTGAYESALASGLYSPCVIALISSNVLYIADQYAGEANGVAGSSSFDLNLPSSVYVDSSYNIYLTDTGNHRIQLWHNGASSGTTVAGTGELEHKEGAVRRFVVIANCGVYTIVQWVIGSSGWTILVGCVGIYGSSPLMLYGPMGATLDSMGNIYVADAYTHRIQFFSTGQRNGTTIAGVSGTTGMLSSQLNSPRSIALDNQLNMYVSN
ncbi:unnamed protein product [Rotaria magnacalcarata]|uniref:NHL repeat containing protein n=1 Tax=Rotaria magnacalcarata TaxID=392030 RepID=A0A816M8I2_9BILA|nr:unnamed protein product [Rotaria magnacalcarata]